MDAHNKLAKEIRTGGPDEQISLDGCSGGQVTDMVNAAFSTPIPAAEMMRIQFIVGGGKKCRQRCVAKGCQCIGFVDDPCHPPRYNEKIDQKCDSQYD